MFPDVKSTENRIKLTGRYRRNGLVGDFLTVRSPRRNRYATNGSLKSRTSCALGTSTGLRPKGMPSGRGRATPFAATTSTECVRRSTSTSRSTTTCRTAIDAAVARLPEISGAIRPVENCRRIRSTRRRHRRDAVGSIVGGDRGRVAAARNSPNRLGGTDPKTAGSRTSIFLRASTSPTVRRRAAERTVSFAVPKRTFPSKKLSEWDKKKKKKTLSIMIAYNTP